MLLAFSPLPWEYGFAWLALAGVLFIGLGFFTRKATRGSIFVLESWRAIIVGFSFLLGSGPFGRLHGTAG